ncbi:hypothetical protein D3C84_1145500 [compost metagenome]
MGMGEVMPGKRCVHGGAFALQVFNVIDCLFGQGQAHAWLAGNSGCQGVGRLFKLCGGQYTVDHAHFIGAGCAHAVASE